MVRKKVGTITLALGLITVGVLLFAQNFIQLQVSDLYKYWPVLLIGLGLEMIIYMVIYGRDGENVKLSIDGLCIFFIILMGLLVSGSNFVNWKSTENSFFGIHSGGFNLGDIMYRSELNENFSKDNISSAYSIKEVKISNDYGDVKVMPSNTKSVRVEAKIWVKYTDEQKARQYAKNAVEIKEGETTEIRPKDISEADKKDFSRAHIDFTVYVPDNVKVSVDDKFGDVDVTDINANITIDSKNGEVNANNIGGNADVSSAFGNIQMKTVKGDVSLSNKNGNIDVDGVTGRATIDSSYGNIDVANVGKDLKVTDRNGEIEISGVSGKAVVENSYGNIHLKDIGGDITVNGKNGNIEANSVSGNVKIDNSYGDINYESDNVNDSSITAHTSYGDINCDKNLTVKKSTTQADLQGTLGSGKWHIELNTRNGNINID